MEHTKRLQNRRRRRNLTSHAQAAIKCNEGENEPEKRNFANLYRNRRNSFQRRRRGFVTPQRGPPCPMTHIGLPVGRPGDPRGPHRKSRPSNVTAFLAGQGGDTNAEFIVHATFQLPQTLVSLLGVSTESLHSFICSKVK